MKIAIGSDHAGYYLKEFIKKYISNKNKHKIIDVGPETGEQSVDYPDYAMSVADGVSDGKYERGILICGSGIGMSIAANRFKGIRATLCEDAIRAEYARRHNNSNILVLAGRFITLNDATEIVDVWLATDFDGGRHARRLEKLRII